MVGVSGDLIFECLSFYHNILQDLTATDVLFIQIPVTSPLSSLPGPCSAGVTGQRLRRGSGAFPVCLALHSLRHESPRASTHCLHIFRKFKVA